jgi:adenylate cyclase
MRGEGGLVLIGGAPGVGKTRLAADFAQEASQKGIQTLVGACYDRNDPAPFLPFVEILEALLAEAPSLEAFRQALRSDATEIARLLPQLRRLSPDLPAPLELPPEQSRRILFSAVVDCLSRLSSNRPLLLILEDLHWGDEGTLSLLDRIARSVSNKPILVLGTYRDNELDPAGPLAKTLDELFRLHVAERIDLAGLPKPAVADMIAALSGQQPPEPLVGLIYSNTEGNPFFVEELFRELMEHGRLTDSRGEFLFDLGSVKIDVPPTLRLVLGRRLAGLGDGAQRALSTAAAIGRSFTFDLLEAATQVEADALLDHVEEAERAGLISSSLEYREARFRFSHELVRQSVLSNLSAPRLQRLHLRVADGIERVYAGILEDHTSDLAHHLMLAGEAADPARTIASLSAAARHAVRQSAYEDALSHLQNALEVLQRIPESSERNERELGLLNDFAITAMAAKGYSAPEVSAAFGRARTLCRDRMDSSERFRTLLGLCAFYFVRGEFGAAREAAEQALAQAGGTHDPESLMRANHVVGCALLFCGEICSARAHLEQGLALSDPTRVGSLVIPFEQDPRVAMRSFLGWALLLLGYPEQALRLTEEAFTQARELSHHMSVAFALSYLVRLHLFRREWSAAYEQADLLINLATEQGLPLFRVGGRVLQTWALAEQGHADEAVKRIRQDFASWQGVGAGFESLSIVVGARVYGEAGRIDAALRTIESGQARSHACGDHLHDAELSRLKGELLLRSQLTDSNLECAERSFLTAIEIARKQRARLLELRALMSLSRFCNRFGKGPHARQKLAEVYRSFTEGFDTVDLREAQSVLAGVS